MPRKAPSGSADPGSPVGIAAGGPTASTLPMAEPIPFTAAADPAGDELGALSTSLAGAGRRARSRKAQAESARPEPAYSQGLRDQLTQATPTSAVASGAAVAGGAAAASAASTTNAPASDGLGPLSRPRVTAGTATSSTARSGGGGATHRGRQAALWVVLGAAALVLAVATAGIVSGRLAGTAGDRAVEASGTTLIHAGASSNLAAGGALANGDEIRVSAGGHATLQIGSSQARLAGGADVVLDSLDPAQVALDLRAGRAYSRVSLPAGGSYIVVTGPYSWSATGTAFDLDRVALPGGTEEITLLALEHSVSVSGPDAETEVDQGSAATVQVGGSAPAGLTVNPIPTSAFSDSWLIANAQADEQLGDPIGALAGVALAPNDTPTAEPSESIAPSALPTDTPTASPSPSDQPSASPPPDAKATPRPTPVPSATPTPTSTATPRPSFSLSATSCPGGVVLSWTKYSGSGFVKYVTTRDGTPISSGTSTNQATTNGFDQIGSTTHDYQTKVVGSGGKVLAASPVESFFGRLEADLGPLGVVKNGVLVWTAGRFPKGCFSEYDINYSFDALPNPQVLVVHSATQSNIQIPSWSTGQTVTFRVVAIEKTGTGPLTVGDSGNADLIYP
jgi:hypothetical protein